MNDQRSVAGAAVNDAPPPAPLPRRPLPLRRTLYQVCLGVTAVWLALDQGTKALAVALLSDRDWPTPDPTVGLTLVRNPYAAFGLGIEGASGLFIVVTVVVVVLVMRALPRTDRTSLAAAYGLIMGGALGNVVDRIVRSPGFPDGHVVDFFKVGWWPVFNIADIGITVGALLVFVLLTVAEREERQAVKVRAGHRSVRPGTGTPQAGATAPSAEAAAGDPQPAAGDEATGG